MTRCFVNALKWSTSFFSVITPPPEKNKTHQSSVVAVNMTESFHNAFQILSTLLSCSLLLMYFISTIQMIKEQIASN